MELDCSQQWLHEFEDFISHLEQETENIKQRLLAPKECCKISDVFHRDSDGLLARCPININDKDTFGRLERLDHKLNSALAMVCYYTEPN